MSDALELFSTTTLLTDFRGQQGVADAASHRAGLVEDEPVAGGYTMAVDQGLGEAGVRAAHADAVVFVEAAFVWRRQRWS